jgi:hypothetical protein
VATIESGQRRMNAADLLGLAVAIGFDPKEAERPDLCDLDPARAVHADSDP